MAVVGNDRRVQARCTAGSRDKRNGVSECKGCACTAPWDFAGRVHQQAKLRLKEKKEKRQQKPKNNVQKRQKGAEATDGVKGRKAPGKRAARSEISGLGT